MNKPKWPEITADTTIEEIQRIHKDIWQYVVENGEKPETPYRFNCVSCEYARTIARRSTTLICNSCPIDWPNGYCHDDKSPYDKWSRSHKTDDAIAVRDIPFKGGSEDV